MKKYMVVFCEHSGASIEHSYDTLDEVIQFIKDNYTCINEGDGSVEVYEIAREIPVVWEPRLELPEASPDEISPSPLPRYEMPKYEFLDSDGEIKIGTYMDTSNMSEEQYNKFVRLVKASGKHDMLCVDYYKHCRKHDHISLQDTIHRGFAWGWVGSRKLQVNKNKGIQQVKIHELFAYYENLVGGCEGNLTKPKLMEIPDKAIIDVRDWSDEDFTTFIEMVERGGHEVYNKGTKKAGKSEYLLFTEEDEDWCSCSNDYRRGVLVDFNDVVEHYNYRIKT